MTTTLHRLRRAACLLALAALPFAAGPGCVSDCSEETCAATTCEPAVTLIIRDAANGQTVPDLQLRVTPDDLPLDCAPFGDTTRCGLAGPMDLSVSDSRHVQIEAKAPGYKTVTLKIELFWSGLDCCCPYGKTTDTVDMPRL